MYDISNQLTKNIGAVYGSGAGLAISPEIETMRKAIDALDFSTKLMLSTQIFMIWVIFKFSSLLVNVILYGRMIEIYIFIAIAPLPLATFPHPEMSSIAKNFLKNFAAVCLQGSLIYLVVAMYGVLVKSVAINIDYNNITSTLLQATMYSLILVISIFTTGKWAKSICNAF
jgi:hypothetical protein